MFDIDTNIGPAVGTLPMATEAGRDAQITVFLNRQRFEYGIEAMLNASHGQQAVLHLALRHEDGSTADVSPWVLNLAANTLRAGMRSGAVAYLGEARFAVLLQDTDAWQAAAYARVAVDIINGMPMPPAERGRPIKACIGGILAGHNRDGEYLLRLAEAATDHAWEKPGCKLHLLHAPE